jgi:hypothetical protein
LSRRLGKPLLPMLSIAKSSFTNCGKRKVHEQVGKKHFLKLQDLVACRPSCHLTP